MVPPASEESTTGILPAGAFLAGSNVSETIQHGIVSPELFYADPQVFVLGMMGSLLATGALLQLASYFGLPVSTTHAIVGAAIASTMPSQPVLGFALGFGSHFLLDAIPHWGYELFSVKKDEDNPMNSSIVFGKNFIFDLLRIGVDALIGLAVGLLLFGFSNPHSLWTLLWGMAGAIMPDALQFVYFEWRHEPVKSLQRLHNWANEGKELSDRPVLGIFTQAVVVLFSVIISKFLFS